MCTWLTFFQFSVHASRPGPAAFANAASRMDARAVRRAAKEAVVFNLRLLAASFGGDDNVQESVDDMIARVQAFDVKPPAPAVGFMVIGDASVAQPGDSSSCSNSNPAAAATAVAAMAVSASAPAPALVAAPAPAPAPTLKRPRRATVASEPPQLTDYPPQRCEVLIPRQDGGRRWNEYCLVLGHTESGERLPSPLRACLLAYDSLAYLLTAESPGLLVQLHSLHCRYIAVTLPLHYRYRAARPGAGRSRTPQQRSLLNRVAAWAT